MKYFKGEFLSSSIVIPETRLSSNEFKIVDIVLNSEGKPYKYILRQLNTGAKISIKSEFMEHIFTPTNNKLTIYFNGNRTTAEWFNPENGRYESASSRCRPTDNYDMETGAHIAIGRLMHKKPIAKMTKEELVDYLYSNFYNVETNTIDISHLDFSKFQCNLNIGWCKANQIQQSGQTAKYVSQKNIHAEHLFQDDQPKEVK